MRKIKMLTAIAMLAIVMTMSSMPLSAQTASVRCDYQVSILHFHSQEDIEREIERQIREMEEQILQEILMSLPPGISGFSSESDFFLNTMRGEPVEATITGRPGGQLPLGTAIVGGGTLGFTRNGGPTGSAGVGATVGANWRWFTASINLGMQAGPGTPVTVNVPIPNTGFRYHVYVTSDITFVPTVTHVYRAGHLFSVTYGTASTVILGDTWFPVRAR
jgi:hypothetical protein